jgi:hypothetical protein
MLERLRDPDPIPIQAVPVAAGEPDDPPPRALPARAVSLAVMAMLAFGVVAGSLTAPGGAESLARTLELTLPAPSAPPTPVAQVPSGGGGGRGGGGGGGGGGSSTPSGDGASADSPAAPPTNDDSGSTVPASTAPDSSSNSLLGLPPIKHVFVIMLSDQGYSHAFAVSKGHPYLAKTLRAQGELINDYYGVASSSLANEVGLISGQGPTQQTAANCPLFDHVATVKRGAESQLIGDGCSYPAKTRTLTGELTRKHDTWKAYIQGIDNGPKGTVKACRHPVFGAADPAQPTSAKSPYVTWTNPFVYFESVTGDRKCASQDVGTNQLAKDLKQVSTTPAFSYIAPDPCDDGSDQACVTGAPAGLKASDTFLKSVVPLIRKSPAFNQDGLLIITFDHAPQTGGEADTTSCCDQPTFPNLSSGTPAGTTTTPGTDTTGTGTTTTGTTTAPATTTTTAPTTTAPGTPAPTTTTGTTTTSSTTATPSNCTGGTGATPGTTTTPTTTAPATTTTTTTSTTTGTTGTTPTTAGCTNPDGSAFGGGQVGMLLISQYVKANSDDAIDTFNHFSLLKTLSDLFGVKRLGYANDASLPEFDAGIFNAASG